MTDSTDNTRGPKLLPCPFCGGEAERITLRDDENFGGDVICCTDCQASSNVEFGFKENLVANWNRRADLAPDPLSDPRVKALVEALEQIADAASVPVHTRKNGINFKKMYAGWRKIATARIDIARAALAAFEGGKTDE